MLMADKGSSLKKTKNAAAENKKSMRIYPLYLIPQALSEEIHTKGDSIDSVSIRRTAGHNYKIETAFRIKTRNKNSEEGKGHE